MSTEAAPFTRPTVLTYETMQDEGWKFHDPRCFVGVTDLSTFSEERVTGVLERVRSGYAEEGRKEAEYDLALRQIGVYTPGMTENDVCGAIYVRNPQETIVVSDAGISFRSFFSRIRERLAFDPNNYL